MPTYCVEYAKSNRSACKGCSIKIDKGQVRIGTTVPGPGDYNMTSWRYLACQKRVPQLVGPSELSGFDALSSASKDLVFAWFEGDVATVNAQKRKADEAAAAEAAASDHSTPKKSKKPRPSSPPVTPMKAKVATPATSTASTAGAGSSGTMSVAAEVAQRDEAMATFGGMSIADLKICLRENGALMSGNKGELVERCVDRKMFGNLPRCPQCGIGRLKVVYARALGHQGQGTFTCPGGYDDDAYVRCSFRAQSVVRTPWIVTASEAAPRTDGRKSSASAASSGFADFKPVD